MFYKNIDHVRSKSNFLILTFCFFKKTYPFIFIYVILLGSAKTARTTSFSEDDVMAKVAIVTDTNSSITIKEGEEMGVFVLPMPFYIDEKPYLEELDLTQEDFYKFLSKGADIKTSQPAPEDVMKLWDKLLTEYDEIVHIPMSSGLSGTVATAMAMASDDPYDGKVFVVDNQRISVTLRRAVIDAANMAKAGMSGEAIRQKLLDEKTYSSIYIMMDTLYYLKKGGRITPAAAAIGTVLKIKPVLQIQGEKLDSFAKARNPKQGREIMIKQMLNDCKTRFDSPDGSLMHIDVAYSYDRETALDFKAQVEASFPGHEIELRELPLSISCHIGPGALAIASSRKIEYNG